MNIRKLDKNEIKSALQLIWSVFCEFEAPDYSDQGIQTFKKFLNFKSIIQKLEKGNLFFWGYFIENELVGVIAMKGFNHISMFFVKKEYQRKGIGKKLFLMILGLSKAHDNVRKITVNASPFSVEIYHRLGFRDTNLEQIVDGLRFTPMEYILHKP